MNTNDTNIHDLSNEETLTIQGGAADQFLLGFFMGFLIFF